jgi:hypothetical protein
MMLHVDLAGALVALELDPEDPADATLVAVVRAIAERRRPRRSASRTGDRRAVVSGASIERAAIGGPTDRWVVG